jgi:hypothetical protein
MKNDYKTTQPMQSVPVLEREKEKQKKLVKQGESYLRVY